jgi:putative intracellular protease/amidase
MPSKPSKVLIIVARRYNGNELWTTLGALVSRGHSFTIASMALEIVDEVTGQHNLIKTLVEATLEIEYDALMVISGNMEDTEAYWTMPHVQSLVGDFYTAKKPIAAICCSVPTVRLAAKGKKVSYFPLMRSKELLERAGALPQPVSITVDGNLVTAENQMGSQVWAEAFCDVLEGKDPNIHLVDFGFRPGKRERKPMPQLERLKAITKATGRTRVK